MDVVDWLLDADPAIRWQVLRDLIDAPDNVVVAERARVATEGWGARLLGRERMAEAVHLVRDKQQPDGTWLLENTHPGEVYFDLEDGDGLPSRWNTLRALRVLRWADGS